MAAATLRGSASASQTHAAALVSSLCRQRAALSPALGAGVQLCELLAGSVMVWQHSVTGDKL